MNGSFRINETYKLRLEASCNYCCFGKSGAIILAGITTLGWLSGWPDLIVGVGIAIINADAAKEVWEAAKDEHSSAKA